MTDPAEMERAAAFRASVRRFLKQTELVATRHGLTMRRYDLLLFIHGASGHRTTTSALLEPLQLNQPSASELIQRAVEAGLIDRTRDRLDRRRIWLELTPKGRTVVVSVFEDMRQARDELAAAIRDAEQRLREAG